MAKDCDITLYGDSIGMGVIFDEARGRYALAPERCTKQIEAATELRIDNRAHMGATIHRGLSAFAREPAKAGTVAVIEYGGNDCTMPWASVSENPDIDHPAQNPLPDFVEALRRFVDMVREADCRAVLVVPPPLDAQRYYDWVTRGLNAGAVLRFLGDVAHIYRWQERYALAVYRVAVEKCCPALDLREAFLAAMNPAELLCVDGIHPNVEGQRVIAEAAIAMIKG